MKSSTLHLIALLLPHVLLPLLLLGHTSTAATSASTATLMATPTPTTPQPPSLHAPRRRLAPATTVMTTTTTTTARTTIRPTTAPPLLAARRPQRQQPQQQQQQTVRRFAAQTASVGGQRVERPSPASASASTSLASARLARNVNASASASSVRQNRSLLSASETQAQRNGNTEAVVVAKTAADTRRYKHLDRRQPNRMSQASSNGAIAATTPKTTPAATTTTTRPTSSTPSVSTASPPTTSAAASGLRHAERQSPLSVVAASTSHHRQSKQSALLFGAAAVDEPMERAAHNSNSSATVIRPQQTPKTPRMIQRLVAGHIQNAEGHSTYQVSAVSSNSTVTNSTTLKPASLYSRRISPSLTSSYRHAKISSTPSPTVAATTTSNPLRLHNALASDTDDRDDDEALLDDPGDFDNWDNGILRLSAGSGKENAVNSKKNKDDSKKTLSDQVRDGKYGLIEKELFRRPPKRPGVLSYLPNKELPIDNERTYGGLNEEDIWLAEDHLLVIKGGSLNDDSPDEPWPPIDDYDAPGRQIKIPPNPKFPPPFPVQLEENGPVQFVGNNKFTVVYPIANESIPVYPAGPEAGYPSSESDSDNEKNLITRPEASQDAAEGKPGNLYPPPYPPWLYHNQTFVNPFLSNARPITFPGLGPFPLGRNGSLDNSNDTDYFDEDDPSLYYPPAYSFVYKNNYSNPVPPGPLVPGIVLPPPANQFSRLEKPEKPPVTTAAPPTSPPRQRVYTSTSTSTTTTTTTTSTTTTAPYRQVITKITEYTPKTIIITPEPPVLSTAIPATPIAKHAPTPPPTRTTTTVGPPPEIVEEVPVPVAIPFPIYPSNKYPSRPNVVNFVPTTPQPISDTLSKTNPIYYEYFEAKRQRPVTSNGIDDFLPTTEKPQRPIKLYASSKRPFKSGGHQQQGHRTYLPPTPPQRPYAQQEVVYITPKPEVRYKRPPVAQQVPIYKRPLENFEREVNAIRQTLQYYQNQQLRDNSIPRTPKAKPIYEYSFDANKNLEPAQPAVGAGNFHPPDEYDEEPFKPMVTYSPPVDDENAFRAIAVDKVDGEERAIAQQQLQQQKYQSSTTLVPVQPEAPYQTAPQAKPKRLRVGAKYLQQPLIAEFRGEPELQYQSTPRTIVSSTQATWVSLQQQQNLNEYAPPQQQAQQQQQVRYHPERLQLPPPDVAPLKHRDFGGYYYNSPPLQLRQNNRFYDEPFQQQNLRPKIVNYRLPQNYAQQQHQQQQQQQPQQPLWNLENDTYVNYAPNRPPLNPDAEFIDPYQPQYQPAPNPYATNQQGQRFPPPPPISHQSQYYAPLHRLPPPPPQQPQPQRQYQPLHRDVLVNYRQPLPPLNPDSEYIAHPQLAHNQAQIYRSNAYRLPPPQPSPTPSPEQTNLYYITPKYRRSNNNNNNNNNNNSNAKPNGRA